MDEKADQQERLSLPILHAVVLATKNGILTEDFKRQPIFHVTGLRSRMQKWLELHQPSVKKGEDSFRFANLLLTMHTRVKER